MLFGLPWASQERFVRFLGTEEKEDGSGWVLKFESPGVRKDDIKVEMEEKKCILRITIGSTSADEKDVSNKSDASGKSLTIYSREISIPQDLCDFTGISASYQDGVLSIFLPRGAHVPPPSPPKLITIKSKL